MAENSYSIPTSYVTASMDIATGGVALTQIFPRAYKLMEIRTYVSVATAVALETMTLTRRPIPGQTTSAVNIGTFDVVSGLAAGDEVRTSLIAIADTDFNAGEELRIICSSGSGTGTVYFGILGFHYDAGPNPQLSFSNATKDITLGVGSIKYAAFTAT